jgi:sigma-B regulation protein RsbU (phosphoserine phosphatase)
MTHRTLYHPRPESVRPAPAARRVLVVDDSRAQRRVVSLTLARGGYAVTEAASGEEALALCRQHDFEIVLSDWMTQGMSGLDFCRAFRALPRESYGYFILLTSKSGKAEVADGLDCGADEFLSKPVNADELFARLRVGERIVSMHAEVVQKNRLIGSTLEELQKLYDALDSDLIEARKLQQTMVRDRQQTFDGGRATLLLRPSGRVGGDLVGFLPLTDRRLALYSIDVSGHGVASAIMTARLAGLMTGASPQQNIAMSLARPGTTEPPEMVAHRLNRLMLEELQVEQYFTMVYADINLDTGQVRLVQAGHPHPAILRRDHTVSFIGQGGMPVGLFPDARFDTVTVQLEPGDRLFLMSDGITECPAPDGSELGEDGLRDLLLRHSALDDAPLLESLVWCLSERIGTGAFPDDVSGVLFRYTGAGG